MMSNKSSTTCTVNRELKFQFQQFFLFSKFFWTYGEKAFSDCSLKSIGTVTLTLVFGCTWPSPGCPRLWCRRWRRWRPNWSCSGLTPRCWGDRPGTLSPDPSPDSTPYRSGLQQVSQSINTIHLHLLHICNNIYICRNAGSALRGGCQNWGNRVQLRIKTDRHKT